MDGLFFVQVYFLELFSTRVISKLALKLCSVKYHLQKELNFAVAFGV